MELGLYFTSEIKVKYKPIEHAVAGKLVFINTAALFSYTHLSPQLSYGAFIEISIFSIRKMYEVGLPARIQSEIDEPMPECAHTPDSSVFCVGIREFSTPLLALMLGMITSVIILVCEVVVHRLVSSSRVREFRN